MEIENFLSKHNVIELILVLHKSQGRLTLTPQNFKSVIAKKCNFTRYFDVRAVTTGSWTRLINYTYGVSVISSITDYEVVNINNIFNPGS